MCATDAGGRMIRPDPCIWFEILVAQEDAYAALEGLAEARCVEVEWHPDKAPQPPEHLLKEFAVLSRKYRPYWPAPMPEARGERRSPHDVLACGIAALHAWAAECDGLISRQQAADAHAAELELTAAALHDMAESSLDFTALATANAGVSAALFALPPEAEIEVPSHVITRSAALGKEQLLLAIAAPEILDRLARDVAEASGRQARFPDWLRPSAAANLRLLAARRDEVQKESALLRAQIAAAAARHDIARALAEMARATWSFEHGGAIEPGDVFARITGWTVDRERVVQALERCEARALARFPAAPRGVHPPLVLRNPWWAQPFELFTRLVGMPAATGADPSMLLAFAVPLLFGYMFGDIGQGVVLVLAGLVLRNRQPVLRLLVPGGTAAMIFGWVFGSVFCREDIAAAVWLRPIEQPLPVLLVPIFGGALLLALGLVLGALAAWWERRLDEWLREDAALLLIFGGCLLAFVVPIGVWIAVSGVAWAIIAALIHNAEARAVVAALGELLERTLQVLINTLSFARVGAFALAHAGLASAVIALADAAGNPLGYALIFVLGNALILLIEGLVVSIQTTRLVLFEFFTRFFRAEGREFRPLAPPAVLNT